MISGRDRRPTRLRVTISTQRWPPSSSRCRRCPPRPSEGGVWRPDWQRPAPGSKRAGRKAFRNVWRRSVALRSGFPNVTRLQRSSRSPSSRSPPNPLTSWRPDIVRSLAMPRCGLGCWPDSLPAIPRGAEHQPRMTERRRLVGVETRLRREGVEHLAWRGSGCCAQQHLAPPIAKTLDGKPFERCLPGSGAEKRCLAAVLEQLHDAVTQSSRVVAHGAVDAVLDPAGWIGSVTTGIPVAMASSIARLYPSSNGARVWFRNRRWDRNCSRRLSQLPHKRLPGMRGLSPAIASGRPRMTASMVESALVAASSHNRLPTTRPAAVSPR